MTIGPDPINNMVLISSLLGINLTVNRYKIYGFYKSGNDIFQQILRIRSHSFIPVNSQSSKWNTSRSREYKTMIYAQ